MSYSNHGVGSGDGSSSSAVAMKTDGLPDGWTLRLHTRGNTDHRSGLWYRTLDIGKQDCVDFTFLR
jgi:hypothetical protein